MYLSKAKIDMLRDLEKQEPKIFRSIYSKLSNNQKTQYNDCKYCRSSGDECIQCNKNPNA